MAMGTTAKMHAGLQGRIGARQPPEVTSMTEA